MKYTVKTFVSALAFASVMSMTTVPASAQDLGFNIPDKETVEAQKKARDNKELLRRVLVGQSWMRLNCMKKKKSKKR